MPPTPLQNSNDVWKIRCGVRKRERPLQERNSIWKNYSVKAEVEELEELLGPDDVDVDFRRILKEARDER